MNNIDNEIKAQKGRLSQLVSLLNLTTPETSDEMTPRIVLLTNEITRERNRMYSVYSVEELSPFEADIREVAKQISEKFEDIAMNFKNKLVSIRSEIASLQNRKKLNQYNR